MHAVGQERERSLHVVVDDEGDVHLLAEQPEGRAAVDHLFRGGVLQPQLDHCGSALDRRPGDLQVVDDRVELHSCTRARLSNVSGSRL